MNTKNILLLGLVLVMLVGVVNAEDWTTFGANAQRTGYTTNYVNINMSDNSTVKKYTTGKAFYQSSPVVYNGYVYFITDQFYQANASDVSQILNTYAIASTSSGFSGGSTPTVFGGYLYVVGGGATIYKFDPANISTSLNSNGIGSNIRGAPLAYGDYIYVASFAGTVYQLNATDLSTVYSYSFGGSGSYDSLSTNGVYLYVGSQAGGLYQFDLANVSIFYNQFTGSTRFLWSSVAMSEDMIYAAGWGSGVLYQLNASNISLILNTNTAYLGSDATKVSLGGGSVFVIDTGGTIAQYNATNITWAIGYNGLTQGYKIPAISGSYVYGAQTDGAGTRLRRMQLSNISQTSDLLWVGAQTSGLYSSVAIAEGRVYFGDDSGVIYQVGEPTTTTTTSTTTTSTTSTTTTTIPPTMSSCITDQSEVLQGNNVVISGTIGQTSNLLDLFWFTANDTPVTFAGAVAGGNNLTWDTTGYFGNYSIACWVNDSIGLSASAADDWVSVVTTTTTTSTTTSTTTTSTTSTTTITTTSTTVTTTSTTITTTSTTGTTTTTTLGGYGIIDITGAFIDGAYRFVGGFADSATEISAIIALGIHATIVVVAFVSLTEGGRRMMRDLIKK